MQVYTWGNRDRAREICGSQKENVEVHGLKRKRNSFSSERKICTIDCPQPVMVLMIVATVFALFGLEFYALIDPPKDSDQVKRLVNTLESVSSSVFSQAIYTVSFIVFIMFCAEWAIFTWAKPGFVCEPAMLPATFFN